MMAASNDGISNADDAAFIVNATDAIHTKAERKNRNGEPL